LPKEEDTVKDVIRSTFQMLWFTNVDNDINVIAAKSHEYTLLSHAESKEIGLKNANKRNIQSISPSVKDEVAIQHCKTNSSEKLDILPDITAECLSIDNEVKSVSRQSSLEMMSNSPLNSPSKPISTTFHIEATTIQIAMVLSTCNSQEWLVQILREILHGKSNGYEATAQVKRRREDAKIHCQLIVNYLMELLLRIEESRDQHGKLLVTDGNVWMSEYSKKNIGDQITDVIVTIAAFSEVCT
jgi:hypothetical protein